MKTELSRLEEARTKKIHCKKWGPYAAQALGVDGVDKRISTLAIAICWET